MTLLLRFIPLFGPAVAWFAARLSVILAFAGGVAAMGAIFGLFALPISKDRAYDAGVVAGMAQASAEHAAAITRARGAIADRTARQIEDRINAESNARHPAAADGVRACGPAIRGCPARDGSPR